jgi:thiol-disulfide isomerase/thioredoxin
MSIVVILIILISGYGLNRNEGFESSGKSVVICKADWCGHCKKAAPEFNKLVGASPITLKDGSKATVKILDADKDKSEVSKYNIKGFPSILIVDGQTITEYPGERTKEGVVDFLNSM